jgi:hypothetical protein
VLARVLELLDGDLGQPDVADLAFLDELPDRAELLFGRHLRIDAVQLPEVDAVDSQAAQGPFEALAQRFGTAVGVPLARAAALNPALVAISRPSG